jgi:hypothetical protein
MSEEIAAPQRAVSAPEEPPTIASREPIKRPHRRAACRNLSSETVNFAFRL